MISKAWREVSNARPSRPQMPVHRRAFMTGLAAALAAGGGARADAAQDARLAEAADRIATIEKRAGGRLGVAVLDTGSGARLLHRADERFPMCSTFKLLASAAVLKRVDAGVEALDRFIPYGQADLLEYAPVTKAHLAAGGMTLGELCSAAIDWSDNTAANLILQAIGGPAGFTEFARSLGDSVTRLDRDEPTLNTAFRATRATRRVRSPWRETCKRSCIGTVLSDVSKTQLESWLIADKVGDKRLRAGLPPSWRIGDKTGSGDHGTANTIAILRPPSRAPLSQRSITPRDRKRWMRATPCTNKQRKSLSRRFDGRGPRGDERRRPNFGRASRAGGSMS